MFSALYFGGVPSSFTVPVIEPAVAGSTVLVGSGAFCAVSLEDLVHPTARNIAVTQTRTKSLAGLINMNFPSAPTHNSTKRALASASLFHPELHLISFGVEFDDW